MVDLALADNRVQEENQSLKSPLDKLKTTLFSKRILRSANNLEFSSDSFKFGIYRWQVEVLTEKQKVTRQQWVLFVPYKLILLALLGVWFLSRLVRPGRTKNPKFEN